MKANPEKFAAVLLCGGSSERLGYPKEMLRADGAPLAVHLVRRLKELFAEVSISSNNPGYLRHLVDVPIHRDEFADAGPLAGIHSGLAQSLSGNVFFLPCDMPAVHNDMIRHLLERAEHSDAQVVLARSGGQVQPLCGIYDTSLIPLLERTLANTTDRSVIGFLRSVSVEYVDFKGREARLLRDIDTPEDMWLLGEAFRDVEPLPVRPVAIRRLGGAGPDHDFAAEEWPVALYVNGIKLATVLCLPTALRELAVGFASYLALLNSMEQVRALDIDYDARRVSLGLDVDDARIKSAVQLLVTSTCGANVYGSEIQGLPAADLEAGFRVRRSHIIECIRRLRAMAPVFARTGCTHQAAFSDGRAVRYFFEDIGRHNAVDKVLGSALMEGADLSRGVLLTTGRLTAELVMKALRRRLPVVASRSAATTHAIQLAERYRLTLAGFARGGRMNVYSGAERIEDA